ncbi:hypothetical protein ACFS7Z_26385 [Pontibacter toksunensis]|uniref:Mobilization protein MobC n=1 Tax=Pontibacter toksunensis TaxID=1332631 RepID=A0ABW6C468_9BACT
MRKASISTYLLLVGNNINQLTKYVHYLEENNMVEGKGDWPIQPALSGVPAGGERVCESDTNLAAHPTLKACYAQFVLRIAYK